MKQMKRAAAFHAAAGLILLLAAAAELWLRRPGQGLVLLAAGWGYVTRNLFKAGRTYGTERAWALIRGALAKPEAEERKKQSSPELPAPDGLCCPNCGCGAFAPAAGAYVCICCGAVVRERGENGEV